MKISRPQRKATNILRLSSNKTQVGPRSEVIRSQLLANSLLRYQVGQTKALDFELLWLLLLATATSKRVLWTPKKFTSHSGNASHSHSRDKPDVVKKICIR